MVSSFKAKFNNAKLPNKLSDVLNNINPVIQFSVETSDTQFPFLDIMMNN